MDNFGQVARPGKVYLVGAGPGAADLLTLKGKKCLARADVVVYDHLVNPRLLSYAPAGARLIYAGKSPQAHTLTQEEINEVLVESALDGSTVVRLKGGDPFLFGRGGEEAQSLEQARVPFEVVPGITSAIAVPAYAGIPVTHRDFTSTFTVVTGHEDPLKEDSRVSWEKIATGSGTLVFLMGVSNLALIVKKLVEHGRSPDTPAALIRWGTSPEQETLTGTLSNIVDKAGAANFKPPAVVVVGEVASLREQLQWVEKKPLFGRRVVVTRPPEGAAYFSDLIEELGGESFEFPAVEIVPPRDYAPLDEALRRVEEYDWIVFTSVNGVKFFFERLQFLGRDIRVLQGIRLCAIGPRTAEELEEKGFLVDCMPPEYRAEALAEEMKASLKSGERVLLPRSHIARQILPETLLAMGAEVDDVEAYQTAPGRGNLLLLREMLEKKGIHIITFTSSSTVHNFLNLLGEEGKSLLEGIMLASIGPITSSTLKDRGFTVDVEAEHYTVEGMLEAILSSIDTWKKAE